MVTNIDGIARRTLPTLASDGAGVQLRLDGYGSLHARSELLAFAEEGTYFRATNATFGAGGIAMGIQTTFSDTANVLFLMRNSSATKRVIPHYIRLICTATGSTTTSSNIAIVTDTANRYSSGGTDLTTAIVNADTGTANTSVVDSLRYNCTAAAVSAKRQVARAVLKTQALPCWALGDELVISFGDPALSGGHGLISGSAASATVKNVGPVVLAGANHCMLVHMWNPANATTAPSWEFELAWWER
jgi:hypothetical protein